MSQIVAHQPCLSARQREVLALLEKGFLVKEMAGKLSISQNTVKKHLQKLYRKCGAENSREAIHFCRFRSTQTGQSRRAG